MFKVDINLDHHQDREMFLDRFGNSSGRQIAKSLELKGKGSARLAQALKNYAWNAHTAFDLRLEGNISDAMRYEKIMDRIYFEDISPVCECW